MYADNLFTLNNVPTLSVGGGFGSIETSRGGEMPVGTRDEVFVSVVQYGRIVLEKSFSGFGSVAGQNVSWFHRRPGNGESP